MEKPERYVNAMDAALTGVSRLVWLLAWTWLVMGHALLLLLGLLLAWAFQVRPATPEQVAAYLQTPVLAAVLTASGLSLLGLVALWWRKLPAVATSIDRRIRRYWLGEL